MLRNARCIQVGFGTCYSIGSSATQVHKMTQPETVATAEDRISLSATTEYAYYPSTSQQVCWAIASLKAPFYEPTACAPVDIVAVIDKSGSMRGGKLKKNVTSQDCISVIPTQQQVCDAIVDIVQEQKKAPEEFVYMKFPFGPVGLCRVEAYQEISYGH